jgi:uncharacterized cupin superfamily protein
MTSAEAALADQLPGGLLVVSPGEGQPLTGTGPTTMIARAGWSEGHVLIFDQQLAPGALMAAHHHTDETQGAYVIAGSIGFWVDGEERIAGPGSYVVRPAGAVHALWNAGDDVARMLEITTPAERYQEFILGVEALRGREGVQHQDFVTHAAAYGTYFADAVTEELTARLGFADGRVGFSK